MMKYENSERPSFNELNMNLQEITLLKKSNKKPKSKEQEGRNLSTGNKNK